MAAQSLRWPKHTAAMAGRMGDGADEADAGRGRGRRRRGRPSTLDAIRRAAMLEAQAADGQGAAPALELPSEVQLFQPAPATRSQTPVSGAIVPDAVMAMCCGALPPRPSHSLAEFVRIAASRHEQSQQQCSSEVQNYIEKFWQEGSRVSDLASATGQGQAAGLDRKWVRLADRRLASASELMERDLNVTLQVGSTLPIVGLDSMYVRSVHDQPH
jgi:hypothetical protein